MQHYSHEVVSIRRRRRAVQAKMPIRSRATKSCHDIGVFSIKFFAGQLFSQGDWVPNIGARCSVEIHDVAASARTAQHTLAKWCPASKNIDLHIGDQQ